ncbi:MAG: FG-GAP-like repeat-containing protein [Gemmatimonadota bacterium]
MLVKMTATASWSWGARQFQALLAVALAVIGISWVVACSGGQLSQQQVHARRVSNEGVVYMDQHNYTRGRDLFQQAVALDPGYADGYANLGIAYFSLGKYDSARVALEDGLKRDPQNLHALYTLGLIFHAQGREYERALAAFEAVAAVDPDDPLVRYYLGRTKAKLGRGEEAVGEFRRAIELDPNNVSAYYALAHELRLLDRLDEWKQALETFNRLSQAGFEGVSASYQGQGKYAEAAPDVAFNAVGGAAADAPLSFAAPPRRVPLAADTLDYASLLDADADGLPDLVVGGTPRLYLNDGGRFTAAPVTYGPLDLSAIAGAVHADVDDDGDLDAVISASRTVLLRRSSARLEFSAELSGVSSGALFADVDHDGDADVLVLGTDGPHLLFNDGHGSFADGTPHSGLGVSGPARAAVFSDFDNDRDVDFALLAGPGDDAALAVYSSNRDGTFSDVAGRFGLGEVQAATLAVGDFRADGYMDLVAGTWNGEVHLLVNDRSRTFAGQPLPGAAAGPVESLRAADLDNDGDLDLVASGPDDLRIWRNRDGHLEAASAGLPPGQAAHALLADDLDGDGLVDLWTDGELWHNRTAGGRWLKVRLSGLNSTPGGLGAKVEVKTATGQQKREVRGGSGDPPVLTFGLADQDSVEFIRILWPSGVRQTELAAAAGTSVAVSELNRKGTSCPILFAWDGRQYRFVSDFLGGAIIGYLVGPGQYYTTDSDEYLPLGDLGLRDGSYVLQVANVLEEVAYLDALELVAVDHPDTVAVYPNERLLSAPPYPEFRPYALGRLRPPQGAWDQDGRPVLEHLRRVDDDWYDGFERSDIHGYASQHSIVLDLGDLAGWRRPVLLTHGWVDYAHSTSNWAASQRGTALCSPRLEVPDGRGGWRVALADMGVPAGLPKHMLVDLSGLLTPGDYRVRITSNSAVYWDQILVGDSPDVPLLVHRRPFTRADLHWRGYPEHAAIRNTFAFRYTYDHLQVEAPWGTHGGAYTRFGDVAELVRAVDDRYAILGHGDELTLEVAGQALPPLAHGQSRTFLLYADGFGKDMDFHSARSLTVGPLPFHGMSTYPYPPTESYPVTAAHREYQLEYNTRWLEGYYE